MAINIFTSKKKKTTAQAMQRRTRKSAQSGKFLAGAAVLLRLLVPVLLGGCACYYIVTADFLAIRTAVLTHAVPTRFADLKLMSMRVRDPGEVEVWTGETPADQDARGRTFRLHRIRGFWEVIGARSWTL